MKACSNPPTALMIGRTPVRRRVERRRSKRRSLDGVATAFELDSRHFGQMHTLCELSYSDCGMGASCPDAMDRGTCVSVGFQSRECPARFGSVIRCDRTGEGYRLAIRFQ